MPRTDDALRARYQLWQKAYASPRAAPPLGRFEIGLVMAGAISGGAYTAGMLDFLFEALDAWTAAKADPGFPQHEVVISVMAGASAGGLCTALAAITATSRFPHIRAGNALAEGHLNPFFHSWVNEISLDRLLATGDLDRPPIRSLLNSDPIDEIVAELLAFKGPEIQRPYLANPLRCIYSLANLRGVPYRMRFPGGQFAHGMSVHADHRKFAAEIPGGTASDELKPDELALPRDPQHPAWRAFADAAISTAAFPLALRPRDLSRDGEDYDFRTAFSPGIAAPDEAPLHAMPHWATDGISPYAFSTVDGGTMNNEPFDLAHAFLAGPNGRNERRGKLANRALIIVDPFTEAPSPGPDADRGLFKTAPALLNAWKNQARFKLHDLMLATDDETYSRYLIAPSRTGQSADHPAIAAGYLGGFSGFFHRSYREHDYLLGRHNCQSFLRRHFTLPPDNPLFSTWTDAQKAEWAAKHGTSDGEVPIVPLVGALLEEEPEPAWPRSAIRDKDRKEILDAVRTRVDKVIDQIRREFELSFFANMGAAVVCSFAKSKISGIAEKHISDMIRRIDAAPYR